MSEKAPSSYEMTVELPGLATDVEDSYVAGQAREAGVLSAAALVPTANMTGAAINYREYRIINKGQSGNGVAVMATLAFTLGVNATDYEETAFVLGAAPLLAVETGDTIAVESLAPGTGMADPGGLVKLGFARS